MSEAIREGWVIVDDKAAEWAVAQIKAAREDNLRWEKHFAEQMRKIREANEQTVMYMQAKLEEYFDSVPHKATATQESYKLPGAKLVRKQRGLSYLINDDELLAHLRTAAPELITTVEKPQWGEYKKRCQVVDGELVDSQTGEIVTGVTVTMREPAFVVEVE